MLHAWAVRRAARIADIATRLNDDRAYFRNIDTIRGAGSRASFSVQHEADLGDALATSRPRRHERTMIPGYSRLSAGQIGVKRLSDVVFALILAAAFFPVISVTAIMVFSSLGRPLLFIQQRAGLGGRTFALFKWRSMTNAVGVDGQPLPDDQRVTPTGRLLRRLRIDELPSIINILRGELSFVGPRPLPASSPINQAFGQARLAALPGLTGLAQVSGNTLLSNDEKLAIDLYYIRSRTFFGDLAIIWQTLLTVAGGERRNELLISRALTEMEQPA